MGMERDWGNERYDKIGKGEEARQEGRKRR